MKIRSAVALVLLLGMVVPVVGSPAEKTPSAGDLRKSGTIRLDVGCDPALREDFQTALALLHSFFYVEARRRFEDLARRDPSCAMNWWGIAMTWYHPLWTPPTPEEMTTGIEAVNRARELGGSSDLERGLIGAIDAYFRAAEEPANPGDPAAMSCHGPRTHGARAAAFRDAFADLHRRFPDNLEVSVFYALSLLGSASPTDKEYVNQLQATAILEPLFEQNPDHPGIAHYIIHAYDYPTMAARALVAARQYDDIAPWVPHALHMPTHIYTRMGLWEDSIEGNLASSAAARDYAARFYGGATIMDDLHALDYLMFAYLQTAREREASGVMKHLRGIESIVPGNEFASAYALGAMPARYALELRRWKDAAKLEAVQPAFIGKYPFALAHVEFARAVGAARTGDVAAAERAVDRLQALEKGMTDPMSQWWLEQVYIQRLAAQGWLEHARKRDTEAVRMFEEAAAIEDRAGTHPVTPGQVLPVREQFGDLLMEQGSYAEALAQYRKSLEAFPNRFNSHFGAGRAAELSGDRDAARTHYAALVEMAGAGDGRKEELRVARAFLAE